MQVPGSEVDAPAPAFRTMDKEKLRQLLEGADPELAAYVVELQNEIEELRQELYYYEEPPFTGDRDA